jgi:hypothetical protein
MGCIKVEEIKYNLANPEERSIKDPEELKLLYLLLISGHYIFPPALQTDLP